MRTAVGHITAIAVAVALTLCGSAAATAPDSVRGRERPATTGCVTAEEASAHAAGDNEETGDGEDGDEDAAPTFTGAFYDLVFTLEVSLDGMDGKQLPISIEEVCDIPKALGKQAAQLAGADGAALLSSRTSVWVDGKRLRARAAASALDGADTAVLRARLALPRRWAEDEDGNMIATFVTTRITITD
jgi:hypothetical protein